MPIKIEGPDLSGLVNHVTNEVFDRVVRRTPVRGGTARDGWTRTTTGDTTSEINNNVPYVGILEEGTSTQAPNGMVRVTLEEVPDIINKYLQENNQNGNQ